MSNEESQKRWEQYKKDLEDAQVLKTNNAEQEVSKAYFEELIAFRDQVASLISYPSCIDNPDIRMNAQKITRRLRIPLRDLNAMIAKIRRNKSW